MINLRVLWLTNIPAPYRTDFFNALGKSCLLTVLFEKKTSSERNASWKGDGFSHFKGVFLKGIPVAADRALCPGVLKYLQAGKYDRIFVSNPLTPTGILAVEYMKLMKIPFIIEGDGGFRGSGKGIREALKKKILRGADTYFSTSKSHDEYFLEYGAKKDALRRYPFTSLFEREILASAPSASEKTALRDRLGMRENKIVLAVGRFVHIKGFDCLLKACQYFDSDTGLYLIGGSPTDEYARLIGELGLCHVHFLDFMSREKLRLHYRAADIFVMPTRGDTWGLVVGEALANGLPVVTTDRCGAALELITENENGCVVRADDEKMLGAKIRFLLENDTLRRKMAEKCLEAIRPYTIERMAEAHLKFLEETHRTAVLFLGSVTHDSKVQGLSGGSVAGNRMQLSILKSLSVYRDLNIMTLSIPSIAAFPKDRTLFSRRHTDTVVSTEPPISAEFIPFLNIPFVKQIWQAFSVYSAAKRILRQCSRCILLPYNLYPQIGLPVMRLERKLGCKTAALLADLPIDDRYGRKGPGSFLFGLFNSLTRIAIMACPHLIVINKQAALDYNPSADYIVAEGGVDLMDFDFSPAQKNGVKNIVYTGGLTDYSGITELIEAMAQVEHPEIELHIYGTGLLEPYVKSKCAAMRNIRYFGKVNRREALQAQKEAWLLMNPRPADDPIARVTFPSKILEYMLSGSPVLSTRLNGFTEDYTGKLFFVEARGSDEMARKIDELAEMDEKLLQDRADRAREFIRSCKTWEIQARKIHQFIKDIENGIQDTPR